MSSNERGRKDRGADARRAPVDVYREEMWAVVSQSWRGQSARRRRLRAARRWSTAAIGLAATLVIGIVVGRWSTGPADGGPAAQAIFADRVAIGSPVSTTYRIAIGEHLRDAETLLVLFESSPQADDELAAFARELAATSRLLVDSSAGRDAETRSLLLDLELLLVQIAHLVDDNAPAEAQIVRDGIAETDALWRTRRLLAEEDEDIGI